MENSLLCPVCNNLCSTQAVACPKCGHPINQANQNIPVENDSLNQNPTSIGSGLRAVLWVFFGFS